jgi:hypothetical protein
MDKFWQIFFAPPGETGAADVVVEPEPAAESVAEPAVEQEPVTESSETLPPPTVPLDVFQRRIAALNRQKEELQRQLAAAAAAQPQVQAPAQVSDIQMEARALAEQMRLNEKADAIARSGQALAPDFMTRIATMNATFGTMTPQFIEAVHEAGGSDANAAKLLYELGGNIAKAAEIMNLSPTRQAIALAKLADKFEQPPAPPRPQAPAPITPKVGGGKASTAVPDLSDPKTSIDDWMAHRQATARSHRR